MITGLCRELNTPEPVHFRLQQQREDISRLFSLNRDYAGSIEGKYEESYRALGKSVRHGESGSKTFTHLFQAALGNSHPEFEAAGREFEGQSEAALLLRARGRFSESAQECRDLTKSAIKAASIMKRLAAILDSEFHFQTPHLAGQQAFSGLSFGERLALSRAETVEFPRNVDQLHDVHARDKQYIAERAFRLVKEMGEDKERRKAPLAAQLIKDAASWVPTTNRTAGLAVGGTRDVFKSRREEILDDLARVHVRLAFAMARAVEVVDATSELVRGPGYRRRG